MAKKEFAQFLPLNLEECFAQFILFNAHMNAYRGYNIVVFFLLFCIISRHFLNSIFAATDGLVWQTLSKISLGLSVVVSAKLFISFSICNWNFLSGSLVQLCKQGNLITFIVSGSIWALPLHWLYAQLQVTVSTLLPSFLWLIPPTPLLLLLTYM